MLNTTRTVREFALEIPDATRLFEQLGIDYCCGGQRSLIDACKVAGVELDRVVESLEKASQSDNNSDTKRFENISLKELITYILDKHHVFTRTESERLHALLAKVCRVHGENHPELLRIQNIFNELSAELEMHLRKEEQVLFPYIINMEESVVKTGTIPMAPFGTVRNPVRMMSMEHDNAGDLLRELRKESSNYTTPPDVCISYQTLYKALEGFEADLHQHIHLENNLLFPRAIEMEAGK
jgi:regulator of cell morphogenesis and NO signaling